MDIAKMLKEARTKAGMTQDQVAEKIMVSRVTVSHWENGKTLPDIVSLIGLSDLYGISLDELVKGDSKMMNKVKKDARDSRNSSRLIRAVAIVAGIVLLAYLISIFVGGGFRDFCHAAIPWVLMAIGIAAAATYYDQIAPDDADEKAGREE